MTKKGDVFICLEDLWLNGNIGSELRYMAGMCYTSEIDECLTDHTGLVEHKWGDVEKFRKHFKNIKDEIKD